MLRIYTILLLISLTCAARAQTVEQLNIRVVQLYQAGSYAEAISLGQVALRQAEQEFGKQSLYAVCLNNLAFIYDDVGDYKAALPLYLEAVEVRREVLGTMHAKYAESLNNLAMLHVNMGNYAAARPLLEEALKVKESTLGAGSPSYATGLSNLGFFLATSLGEYSEAEVLFRKAMEIRERTLGVTHIDYANSLNNLAYVYEQVGNFAVAETYYKQALKIKEKNLGTNHPEYATGINNIALLYIRMGNYDAAEPLMLQALSIWKQTLGENHERYATGLVNLTALYKKTGRYKGAEDLYLQALDITRRAVGEMHNEYAAVLNNLAALYIDAGLYASAEPLLEQALAIRKKVLGEEHPDYATSLNSMAFYYAHTGSYKKAEPLYKEAMQIWHKILGIRHPSYATSINNLAGLYESMGSYDMAAPLYIEALAAYKSQAQQQLGFLSENEQEKYFQSIQYNFDNFNSFALNNSARDAAIVIHAGNLALFNKGLQLNAGISMRKSILGSGDTAIINLFDRWTGVKLTLAKQYSIPVKDRLNNLKEMEAQANDLEKQLIRSSQAFKGQKERLNIETKDIQAKLGKDEAAIEFISFGYHNGKDWTDSIMYAALVLRPGTNGPVLVPLFEEKQLDSLFNKAKRTNVNATISSLYQAQRGMSPTVTTKDFYGNDMYTLIWKPLEEKLRGVNTVYYAPSGKLHSISFAALIADSTKLLTDKYHLVPVGSTAAVLNGKESTLPLESAGTVTLLGGVNYDITVPEMVQQVGTAHGQYVTYSGSGLPYVTRGDANRRVDWSFLQGTQDEVKAIEQNLKKQSIPVTVYTGSAVTENLIKTLQGKKAPAIMHIATHGFFLPNDKEDLNKQTSLSGEAEAAHIDNPLLRTGLLFAGANNKWVNDTLQLPEGLDDGILTAYEVAGMELSNTKLAVLSACQTGLGDIKGSEGVYGLQRAFKMAGVQYLIVSLWSVPDAATQEFMTDFYTRWAASDDLKAAFAATQQAMRSKYKDPYMWAAFVLVQ